MGKEKALKDLVPLSSLKFDFMKKRFEDGGMVYISFDPDFDAFYLMLLPPTTETTLHYVCDDIGLLYRRSNNEVVGIQIECFVHKFLKAHANVLNAWKVTPPVQDTTFGDLTIAFSTIEQRKQPVVRELIRASSEILSNKGLKLPKFDNNSYSVPTIAVV